MKQKSCQNYRWGQRFTTLHPYLHQHSCTLKHYKHFVCSAFRGSKNKNPLLILAINTSLASWHDENNWRQHMTSTLVVKNVFIVAFNSIYLFGSLHACKVPLAQLFWSIVFMCMQMGSLVLEVSLWKQSWIWNKGIG